MNLACRLLLAVLALFLTACQAALVYETRSGYSHIRVMEEGSRRSLIFVGDGPIQAVETLVDLRDPNRLQHPYARTMMAGLIYRPDAASSLMVGLGGGALVRFLDHHFPDMALDVVEIDAAVVSVARDYFALEPGPRTRIFVEDGFEYLRRTRDRYDLIFLNAHLHPDKGTDAAGMPLQFQEAEFLKGLHQHLRPGGVVMVNMIGSRDSPNYLGNIRAAFPFVAVLRPVGSGNLIAVCALVRPSEDALRKQARALDERGGFGFSFERLLDERLR